MFTITDQMETAVLPHIQINQPVETGGHGAALWVCDPCQVWWGSQNGPQPEARYLLKLAEPNTQLFKWEDYRGWHEKVGSEHVCFECGQSTSAPRFSLLGQVNGREA
jgi:hypothetical protein